MTSAPAFHARLEATLRYVRFSQRYRRVLRPSLPPSTSGEPALLVSGPNTSVAIDLLLSKGLMLGGYSPVAIVLESQVHKKYYQLAGVEKAFLWQDFLGDQDFASEARDAVSSLATVDDVLSLRFANADVGRIAISMLFRRLRIGSLDLRDVEMRDLLSEEVARSMSNAVAAANIVKEFGPRCAIFPDVVYGRRAELFANVITNGATVVRWRSTHSNNSLLLTRYTTSNRMAHPETISPESWERVCRMPMTDDMRVQLQNELYHNYAAGTWYGESGTQFGVRLLPPEEVRRSLGLDSSRPTAMICSHILWDAPMCWEKGLFEEYEQWLVETVRASCDNDRVNWLLKIHPANVGKQRKEGYPGEPAELPALRKHLGEIPANVKLVPANSDISTFSILSVIDYCLTVRGTIGIEAACRGIPVLTANNGRYSCRGFTVDSSSSEQYLAQVRNIDSIPPLTDEQRGLAERFAYGFFILRPWALKSATFEFNPNARDSQNFDRASITVRTAAEWQTASDLRAFVKWLNETHDTDYLSFPPPA